MHYDDTAWHHPRIKELQTSQRTGIEISIQVHQAESHVNRGAGRMRKKPRMEANVAVCLQQILESEKTGGELSLREYACIDLTDLWESGECIEQVKCTIFFGFADDLSRAPLIDAQLGIAPSRRRCARASEYNRKASFPVSKDSALRRHRR